MHLITSLRSSIIWNLNCIIRSSTPVRIFIYFVHPHVYFCIFSLLAFLFAPMAQFTSNCLCRCHRCSRYAINQMLFIYIILMSQMYSLVNISQVPVERLSLLQGRPRWPFERTIARLPLIFLCCSGEIEGELWHFHLAFYRWLFNPSIFNISTSANH